MPRDLKHGIPDFNIPKYENLILSLQKGTCIFTGAGISKLGGYKFWEELKDEMVDYFWKNKGKLTFKKRSDLDLSLCENLKKHGDIIETFDYLYLLNSSLFISGIKDIFYADSMRVSNKVFQVLNQLTSGKKRRILIGVKYSSLLFPISRKNSFGMMIISLSERPGWVGLATNGSRGLSQSFCKKEQGMIRGGFQKSILKRQVMLSSLY